MAEVLGILASVAALCETVITLAADLRGVAKGSAALVQQLETFLNVLKHVDSEFQRTLSMCGWYAGSNKEFKMARALLEKCLGDCEVTCQDYETLLSKVRFSKFRAMRWKQSKEELARLHTNLEARKSTLPTVMVSIR